MISLSNGVISIDLINSFIPIPAVFKYNNTDFTADPNTNKCLDIVYKNASTINICNGNVSYEQISMQQVDWTWSSNNLFLHGNITLNNNEMLWSLQKASDVIRAVDLPSFIGASDLNYGYTTSSKTWCDFGIGCQEWSCTEITNLSEVSLTIKEQVKWVPSDIPWASKALTKDGRTNFVGASKDNEIGFSLWSNQYTLPYQIYKNASYFSAGPSRINVNLRCGSTLPYIFKIGFFQDISLDGKVNLDDAKVWGRKNYPIADITYRQSLIMKLGNDYTSYIQQAKEERISFNETLKYIAKLSEIADGQRIVLTLVGWQMTGHDTGFPTLDIINPQLGTIDDLIKLSKDAKEKYNTVLSYHANLDEAYLNYTFTDPSGDALINHPIPNSNDGQSNKDSVPEIIAKGPDGKLWMWSNNANDRSDPLQGGAYHISKTKDFVSGLRMERLKSFLKTIPLSHTLHSDAYRDINVSWEDDEAGFIAEDEEVLCGVKQDSEWLLKSGLSLGVEGSNGMASACNSNVPEPISALVDYYFHGNQGIGSWNRIVDGSSQGLDEDITPTSFTNPFNNWEGVADRIYTQAKVFSMRMTSELVSNGMFENGGNQTFFPYGNDTIKYINGNGGFFIPAIEEVTWDAPKSSPSTLNLYKAYIYQQSASPSPSVQEWKLPLHWIGLSIHSHYITPQGIQTGPEIEIKEGNIVVSSLLSGRPLVLTVDKKEKVLFVTEEEIM